jgi:hypothetical protein
MFADKAEKVRHDQILWKLLQADDVIFGQNGEFILLQGSDELDFVKV